MRVTRQFVAAGLAGLAFGLGGCGLQLDLAPPELAAPVEHPTSGYSREAFLPSGWPDDPDLPGRDLRHELLYERSGDQRVRMEDGRVLRGAWLDPYTGRTVRDADDLEIDHVVALADAWRRGASAWSPQRRFEFATDPDNLVPTELNSEKQDSAPGDWDDPLLTERGECFNARRYLQVSDEYGLPLDAATSTRLTDLVAQCPLDPGYYEVAR